MVTSGSEGARRSVRMKVRGGAGARLCERIGAAAASGGVAGLSSWFAASCGLVLRRRGEGGRNSRGCWVLVWLLVCCCQLHRDPFLIVKK